MIYLDNAATSFPKPEGVSARMKKYMDEIGAPVHTIGSPELLQKGSDCGDG